VRELWSGSFGQAVPGRVDLDQWDLGLVRNASNKKKPRKMPPEASGYWPFDSCHSWMCTEEDSSTSIKRTPAENSVKLAILSLLIDIYRVDSSLLPRPGQSVR